MSLYPSKYERIKENAQKFANERGESVYITKAIKQNHYCIIFEPRPTKNHPIIEEVKPEGI